MGTDCSQNCSSWQHQERIVGILPLQHSRPESRLHWRLQPGAKSYFSESGRSRRQLGMPRGQYLTDGSVREDVTAWGNATWKDNERAFEWFKGKQGRTSSFKADCEAWEDELVCVGTSTTREDSVIV